MLPWGITSGMCKSTHRIKSLGFAGIPDTVNSPLVGLIQPSNPSGGRTIVHSSWQRRRGPISPQPHQKILSSKLWVSVQSERWNMYLHVVLIRFSVTTSDSHSIFMRLSPFDSLFLWTLSPCPFFSWICLVFILSTSTKWELFVIEVGNIFLPAWYFAFECSCFLILIYLFLIQLTSNIILVSCVQLSDLTSWYIMLCSLWVNTQEWNCWIMWYLYF